MRSAGRFVSTTSFQHDTRLLVVTEGILTARLQRDLLSSGPISARIVLDEFHERSIHADLAIALARQAWRARDDLRLVVMSATLDAQSVSAYLGAQCPSVEVPGRLHPLEVTYAAGEGVAAAAGEAFRRTAGHVLGLLLGAAADLLEPWTTSRGVSDPASTCCRFTDC